MQCAHLDDNWCRLLHLRVEKFLQVLVKVFKDERQLLLGMNHVMKSEVTREATTVRMIYNALDCHVIQPTVGTTNAQQRAELADNADRTMLGC